MTGVLRGGLQVKDSTPVRSRSVQSVEIAVRLLAALAQAGRPLMLSELSTAMRMAPAKVHRYMASFVETGMVEHRRSGTYDLGPQAAAIGIAAVARVDVVNHAADALPALVDRTGTTAMLSVWGSGGPTVVRWERADPPLVTALGVGSVLPLMRSATGQAFLAWLPERLVAKRARAEGGPTDAAELAGLRARLRSQHVTQAEQSFIPGLYALAAPVLDMQGQAAAVVTLIGTDAALTAPHAPARQALAEFAPLR